MRNLEVPTLIMTGDEGWPRRDPRSVTGSILGVR
jgi:hypothetical protein